VVGRIPPAAAWYQPRHVAKELSKAAASGRTTVLTQVISGMGGIGKTQLAAWFARHLADERQVDLLVWVSASTEDAIITGYAEAAATLNLADAATDKPQAAVRFLNWLKSTDLRWLVVLDDLTQPAHLSGWWPPSSSQGRTLITTRRRDAALRSQGRTMLHVGLFSEAEARAYLAQALPSQPPGEIDQLAVDLGHLPLAIAQAAAYIRERELSCAQYRGKLADRRRKLHRLIPDKDALPDEQRATVAATWSLSVEAANQLTPRGVAAPVLDLASVLDPNGTPARLFTTLPALTYLADTVGRQVAADAATDALHNLQLLNLLTVDKDQDEVRVHALVQRATREPLSDRQASRIAHAAADALQQLWPGLEPDAAATAVLRANAAALHEHTGDALLTPGVHAVLFRAGNSLGETGQLTAAQSNYRQLLDVAQRVLGPDHRDTLITRSNLATWRGRAGDVAGAAEAFEELLSDVLRMLGPDHADTLSARGNLAVWRGRAGDVAGATEAFQQVLADQLRVLGPDHPNTLSTRSALADLRGTAGDAAGAAEAFDELLPDRSRVLGPEHPDTLMTRCVLADWRGQAGDTAGTVDAFNQLLDDALRALGPDHSDTLTIRRYLATWQGQTGDPVGAVKALQQLLSDQLRVLGPDHPNTLTTRSSLATWQGRAGDAAGATDAFKQLLTDRLRVLGPDHPDTLTTRNNLAHWLGQAGDAAGAAAAFEELLADSLRVLGRDHPDTLNTRNNLAHWRGRAGKP
jgi:hypothetical protein